MNKYDYVKYDEEHMRLQAKAKNMFMLMDELLNDLNNLGSRQVIDDDEVSERVERYFDIAETKLEEAYMYFGKIIRDRQIITGGSSKDIAERSDG